VGVGLASSVESAGARWLEEHPMWELLTGGWADQAVHGSASLPVRMAVKVLAEKR
jgi:hypothetical protein